jgi:hypothetical protein
MGGQVHGPNLGMAPRLGYRRTEDPSEVEKARYLSN